MNRISSSKEKPHQFLGLSLSGGKTSKSALAVLDFYPKENKFFLKSLHEKIQSDKLKSADVKIFELIQKYKETAKSLGIDVPLVLPKCIRCKLKCPGYEVCAEPAIIWLWKKYRQNKKKTKKLFTPYTERCAEAHLAQDLEEPFIKDHALGANLAPIVARAQYLKKRIPVSMFEAYPQLSLWRIGRQLSISKSHLRRHKHSVEGVYVRSKILETLTKKNITFMYNQDIQSMTLNLESFEAYLCAITGLLAHLKQVEKRPINFPKSEGWITMPQKKISFPTMKVSRSL